MNILVTGAKGFIGKNLVAQLHNIAEGKARHDGLSGDLRVFEYDVDTDTAQLETMAAEANFVFHLAGINRPKSPDEFNTGNVGLTSALLDILEKTNNTVPVMLSSSIQAELDNPYGLSKREAEELLADYGKRSGAQTFIYRFPNVFGKWCRPNYNSAVATFCHNIAADIPITISDPAHILTLVYIDDLIEEMMQALAGRENRNGDYCRVPVEYQITLGELVERLRSFRASRENLSVPDMSDPFERKLCATYLSYIPPDQFGYSLKMNCDERGSFTELLRTLDRGQFSVNISKPHIVKGNHWHHTKFEKFAVVSGRGVIRFRRPDSDEIYEYFVSGDQMKMIDIPAGYSHNIENLGETDMVTFMWVSECFDPSRPDTYFLSVAEKFNSTNRGGLQ